MRDFIIVTIDCETSGIKPASRYALLSLALKAYETGEELYEEVNYSLQEVSNIRSLVDTNTGEVLAVTDEAMAINGLHYYSNLLPERLTLAELDLKAARFLMGLKPEDQPQTVIKPLGLNVGSFDLEYLEAHLPKTFKQVHYQVMDLNSIMADRAVDKDLGYWQVRRPIEDWAKAEASKRLPNLAPHHALYDVYMESFMYAALKTKAQPWMEEDD